MILYTPLVLEEVLQGWDQPIDREYINYQGKMFYVDKTKDGSYELAQLISTNPFDYMNENYMPGTLISRIDGQ